MREGIARSVRWRLGGRRVGFRPRTDVKSPTGEKALEALEEEDIGGTLPPSVISSESVPPDPAAGRRLRKAWRAVLLEMVFISVLTVGLALLGGARALSWMRL